MNRMAQTYAVGLIDKDKDGYWKYVQFYLTDSVDIDELLELQSEQDVIDKIGNRFKPLQTCEYHEFTSPDFFEKHTLDTVYILEHTNGNRWSMNIRMMNKKSKRVIQLKYTEYDE
jgi:hypothetical protein